jgi:hypothetical protein
MILMNITMSISPNVLEECLLWTRNEYIPTIMGTGLFTSYRFTKVLAPIDPEQEDNIFSLQFICPSFENLYQFDNEFRTILNTEVYNRYPEQVLLFCSIMEILEESEN